MKSFSALYLGIFAVVSSFQSLQAFGEKRNAGRTMTKRKKITDSVCEAANSHQSATRRKKGKKTRPAAASSDAVGEPGITYVPVRVPKGTDPRQIHMGALAPGLDYSAAGGGCVCPENSLPASGARQEYPSARPLPAGGDQYGRDHEMAAGHASARRPARPGYRMPANAYMGSGEEYDMMLGAYDSPAEEEYDMMPDAYDSPAEEEYDMMPDAYDSPATGRPVGIPQRYRPPYRAATKPYGARNGRGYGGYRQEPAGRPHPYYDYGDPYQEPGGGFYPYGQWGYYGYGDDEPSVWQRMKERMRNGLTGMRDGITGVRDKITGKIKQAFGRRGDDPYDDGLPDRYEDGEYVCKKKNVSIGAKIKDFFKLGDKNQTAAAPESRTERASPPKNSRSDKPDAGADSDADTGVAKETTASDAAAEAKRTSAPPTPEPKQSIFGRFKDKLFGKKK